MNSKPIYTSSLWLLLIFVIMISTSACSLDKDKGNELDVDYGENKTKVNSGNDKGRDSNSESKRISSITEQNRTEKLIDPEEDIIYPSEQITKKKLDAKRIKVKGIYVSGWIAGSKKMDALINMLDNTELNAMVIDVKNDLGEVSYSSKVPEVNQINTDQKKMIPNITALMKKLKSKNIYTIARIVVFKDPSLSTKKPDLAMHNKTGELWKDRRGVTWVDPYQKEVWNYNVSIAKEAADLGFDEIQFDYVRFPDNGIKVDQEVLFNNPGRKSKSEIISKFLDEAKKQLTPKGVFISADVFGLVTTTADDMGIGQDWAAISETVDYISPMVYPSHYSKGMYGLTEPDLKPYEVVKNAMLDGQHKNDKLKSESKNSAIIRPWLQSFTASWVKPHLQYGYDEVKLQVKAAREQGVDEFLLWNALCKYSYR